MELTASFYKHIWARVFR